MSVSVILPRQVDGSATGWAVRDFIRRQARSEPAAGGLARIELAQLEPDELWLVDHMVVACTSTTMTNVRIYADAIDPLRLLDGSRSGNFDVADWPNGLQLAPSTALILEWVGASDGAIGTVTFQARAFGR